MTAITDKEVRGWDVSSHTDPDKKYRVSRTAEGFYRCTCMAWRFLKNREDGSKPDCKHIAEIRMNIGTVDKVVQTARIDRILGSKAERISVRTSTFTITELTQTELLAGPLRRKVRRGKRRESHANEMRVRSPENGSRQAG